MGNFPKITEALKEFEVYLEGFAKFFFFRCPEEIYIRKLVEKDAELVNELWPHKYENSVEYIKMFISMNGGYGAFTKNNELVSWVLKNHMGTLGILQTVQEHRRKGYGTLVTMALSKEIAEEGHVPLGTVLVNNRVSQMMFSKLGFRSIDEATFVCNNGSK